ncbi:MAG TPA: glycoside hydrolase family 30 beta sandwich domain-containing protein [Isosphaeraceae bacterium]|jgi:glucosylceramidase|nr:glycoside hydrolase family 30 beta sandwich domain-containing protein [Isosphaeraceae bacterium]
MFRMRIVLILIGGAFLGASNAHAQRVELWLTDPGGSSRFEKQKAGLTFGGAEDKDPTIRVDRKTTYQAIDGFGYTLTGGSAGHILRMDADARAALLRELFATDGNGLGVSYLRVSIGASDLNERAFSYDDLPPGKVDPELAKFSLAPDRTDVIPVLKEVLKIAPALKVMGSPWSPPAWMKSNRDTVGGSLKPEFYGAYANYFVKYIQGMKAEGIRIDAVTVQNEPLHPGNNPSLLMEAREQAAFIKGHLGPAFKRAGLDTKIIIYDHNCDRPDYPLTILNDPKARRFVDGTAFHLYAGKIDALSAVHAAFPDKNLYFTEQWVGAPGDLRGDLDWHTRELTIGATRNWSRTVLEWNLAADSKYLPHTPGGCTSCLGAVTIDGNTVTRNPAYYIVAHASKFVRPGSVRIATNELPTLPNVAFTTPGDRTVVIVLNDARSSQTFGIRDGDRLVTSTLPAGAVGTYVWP